MAGQSIGGGKTIVIAIAVLILPVSVSAATIDGSGWPTSGAASAGTTGFSSITGGTHVGSSDVPAGSSSTGYIVGADNAALTFRVDPTTIPLQTDNDYWLRFWVKAARNGTSLAADSTNIAAHSVVDSSTKLRSNWYVRNNGVTDGLGLLQTEFLPGGTGRNISGATASNLPAVMPFNEWNEVTLHIHKNGKNGEYALYFNRSLIRGFSDIATLQHRAAFTADAGTDILTSVGHTMVEGETVTLTTTGTLPAGLLTSTTYFVRNPTTDTYQLSLTNSGSVIDITDTGTGTHTHDNGGITLSALGSQWTINLGAINGITWQIAGDISTSSASTIQNTPLVDEFERASDWMTKIYPSIYADLTYGGSFWNKTTGNLTVTPTVYNSGGISPDRTRFVLSGSTNDSATLETTSDIGVLPYNSYGWSTLFFPMLYVPDGEVRIVVNDEDGDPIYEIDVADGNLNQDGSSVVSWTQADRYFLALHFSENGSVHYSLHDLTAGVTSRNFWSGELEDWIPQTIGTLQYEATRASSNIELDGLVVARWLPLFGVDSLSNADAFSVSPTLSNANHIPQIFGQTRDAFVLPGSMYSYRADEMYRFRSYGITGRSGRTLQNFADNILPYMTDSRGLVVSFVDGGSINDINAINSDETARTNVVNGLLDILEDTITQSLANQNRVWVTTMINRVQGTSYTTTERSAILDYNIGIRTLAQDYPSVYFSDVASDVADHSTLFTSGDDTHFNTAGDTTYATYMVDGLMNENVAPVISQLGPTGFVDGSTSDDTTPTFTFRSDDGNENQISFELEIDNDADFSSPVDDYSSSFVDAGSHSYTSSSLSNGSYYWRVRATDGTNVGSWSAANSGAVAFIINDSGGGGGGSSRNRNLDRSATSTPVIPTTAPSTPAVSLSYAFTRDLALGNRGEDVKALQQILITKGYLSADNATGYFGPLTQAALSAYQAALGISPAVGYFGPLTRTSLSTSPIAASQESGESSGGTLTRNLTIGSDGEDVRTLQKFLNSRGFIVSPSGAGSVSNESTYFGDLTREALAQFQLQQGIQPAVGYFGEVTRALITKLLNP